MIPLPSQLNVATNNKAQAMNIIKNNWKFLFVVSRFCQANCKYPRIKLWPLSDGVIFYSRRRPQWPPHRHWSIRRTNHCAGGATSAVFHIVCHSIGSAKCEFALWKLFTFHSHPSDGTCNLARSSGGAVHCQEMIAFPESGNRKTLCLVLGCRVKHCPLHELTHYHETPRLNFSLCGFLIQSTIHNLGWTGNIIYSGI